MRRATYIIDQACYRDQERAYHSWQYSQECTPLSARAIIARICSHYGVENVESVTTRKWGRWGRIGGGWCRTPNSRYDAHGKQERPASNWRTRIHLHTSKASGRAAAGSAVHEACHYVSYMLGEYDSHGAKFMAYLEVEMNRYAQSHNLESGTMPRADETILAAIGGRGQPEPERVGAGYVVCPSCGFTVHSGQFAAHNEAGCHKGR